MTNLWQDLRFITRRKHWLGAFSVTMAFFLGLALKSRFVEMLSLSGEVLRLGTVATEQLNLLCFSFLTALDLGLVVAGIYGVMTYSVAPRTQEIGLWLARGANTSEVLKLVVRQGLHLAVIGTVIGLATAMLLTGWLKVLRVGSAATDPLTFLGVTLSLSTVAFFVYYLPARRTTQPVVLRQK